jgi:hypothetical protein
MSMKPNKSEAFDRRVIVALLAIVLLLLTK